MEALLVRMVEHVFTMMDCFHAHVQSFGQGINARQVCVVRSTEDNSKQNTH